MGGVKSRTRGRVGKVAPAGWKSREEETKLTPPKAVQSDILSMPIEPAHQNKKDVKMKDDPVMLMKTNGQLSDKMA